MHTKTVALREAILAVLDGYTSINVRSLCYVLESTQVIHKTEADFDKVERLVVDLRREGLIPFGKISEGHRERLVPPTYASVGAFLTWSKIAISAIYGRRSPTMSKSGVRRMA